MDARPKSLQAVADQVRTAFESSDLAAFGHLLDPDVRWGPPGSSAPPCRTREQVIAWYLRGKQAGARAQVTEIVLLDSRLLVGLMVTAPTAKGTDETAPRWQLLTVSDGLIVDVVGFDQREEALAYLDAPGEEPSPG